MTKKISPFWFLLFVPVIFVCWFIIRKNNDKPLKELPFFGPKVYGTSKKSDLHTVGEFSFTDQFGETFSSKNTAGKIYVTEFFFTTCHSICPVMNSNLQRVYSAFKDADDVLILSHTVDPEIDTVQALKAYADRHGVNDKRWIFLTGPKQSLYEMARKSYLLNAEEGNGGPDDFIHTQNFALIDKEKHIRGYYDGTDTSEVNRLIKDIQLLKKFYAYEKNNSAH